MVVVDKNHLRQHVIKVSVSDQCVTFYFHPDVGPDSNRWLRLAVINPSIFLCSRHDIKLQAHVGEVGADIDNQHVSLGGNQSRYFCQDLRVQQREASLLHEVNSFISAYVTGFTLTEIICCRRDLNRRTQSIKRHKYLGVAPPHLCDMMCTQTRELTAQLEICSS